MYENFEDRDRLDGRETKISLPDDRHHRRFIFRLPEGSEFVVEFDEDCVPVAYGVDSDTTKWHLPYTDNAGSGLYTTYPRDTVGGK